MKTVAMRISLIIGSQYRIQEVSFVKGIFYFLKAKIHTSIPHMLAGKTPEGDLRMSWVKNFINKWNAS